jgi:competence protein ComEC
MNWQVFICDVGQGDAMVINLHDHRAIVVDVGPDPELIDQCLKRLHVDVIELLILTHPHADHVEGLSGAEKNRAINARWYGDVAVGTRAHIGEYSIEVLWPLTVGAKDSNPNNISIAALISSPELTLFASGDIEPIVQEQLRGKVGKVDLYKVAHHGSRFQDPALMRELSPTVALISTGVENRYGHPAPSTISSLEQVHARVLRTDRDGAIAIAVADHQVRVKVSNSGFRWISFG